MKCASENKRQRPPPTPQGKRSSKVAAEQLEDSGLLIFAGENEIRNSQERPPVVRVGQFNQRIFRARHIFMRELRCTFERATFAHQPRDLLRPHAHEAPLFEHSRHKMPSARSAPVMTIPIACEPRFRTKRK